MNARTWACCLVAVEALACRGAPDAPASGKAPPQPVTAQASPPVPAVLAAPGAAAPASAPRTWHGIGLRQVTDCDQCCGLVFPEGFGVKGGDELKLLEEIAMAEGRAKELGCHFHYKKQALAQLRNLAVKAQSREAASVILHAGGDGGVDLGGGELAETFGAEYLAPVLLGCEALGGLVNPALERNAAEQLCAAANSMVPDQAVDVAGIVASLRRRGLNGFAKTIQTTCAALSKERR